MPFNAEEKKKLLAAYMVGPKVVQRIEEAGYNDLASLSLADPVELCDKISTQFGARHWKDHKLALQALKNAISVAIDG